LHFYDAKIATYSQKGQQQKVVSKCDKYMCVYKKKRNQQKSKKENANRYVCVWGSKKKEKHRKWQLLFLFFLSKPRDQNRRKMRGTKEEKSDLRIKNSYEICLINRQSHFRSTYCLSMPFYTFRHILPVPLPYFLSPV